MTTKSCDSFFFSSAVTCTPSSDCKVCTQCALTHHTFLGNGTGFSGCCYRDNQRNLFLELNGCCSIRLTLLILIDFDRRYQRHCRVLPLLTLASAVSPVHSDGGGVRRDHLNDVCRTEEMQRSGFFGRQVAINILRHKKTKQNMRVKIHVFRERF